MRAEEQAAHRSVQSGASPRVGRSFGHFVQSHFSFASVARLAGLWACFLLCVPSLVRAQEVEPTPKIVEGGTAQQTSSGLEPDDDYDYADEDEGGDSSDESELDRRYSGVEEMTITGTVGGIVQADAAESAVQFDADELDALGATELTDIARVTPNLQITQAGATSASFFIRGVGLADFSANSASAVAVYQDGVPLNASALQLAGIFDLQNLAVLRGPQAWGSTRNASAGAILLESRRPTGEYHAELRSEFGSYWSDVANSALIQRYNGAVEFPIVPGRLDTRISFMVQQSDPFQTNGCGEGQPRTGPEIDIGGVLTPAWQCGWVRSTGANPAQFEVGSGLPAAVGNEGRWAVRGLFHFTPDVLEMDWTLRLQGSRLDEQSTLGQAIGTFPFGQNSATLEEPLVLGGITARSPLPAQATGRNEFRYADPDYEQEYQGYVTSFINQGLSPADASLAAQQKLAPILASQRPLDVRPYRGDYNRVGQTTRDTYAAALSGSMEVDAGFLGPVAIESVTAYDGYDRSRDQDLDFTPLVLFEWAPALDRAWQFFQELKAKGETSDGSFRWEVGGYYLMENIDAEITQLVGSTLVDTILRSFDQEMRSFAFYGGFGWDFLENFTLDAGVRYNWEEKSFQMVQETILEKEIGNLEKSVWTAPTGLVSLTYRFTPDVSAYWKYTRGWKGGHYNANRVNDPPAQPETVDSVEAGFNGSWFDSRLRLSGAFFYYKYQNYQLFLFESQPVGGPVLEIVNANDAEQYGAELELQTVPLQDLSWVPEFWGDLAATVRFGWLESQFLDFTNEIFAIDNNATYVYEVNYTGNRLPNAPQFKVSGSVEYPLNFGRYGTLVPRYDVDWTDDIFFDATNGRGTPQIKPGSGGQLISLPPYSVGQSGYVQHNLRLSWTNEEGNLSVAAWVRNLTDTRFKTSAFDASIFANLVINFVGPPRTAGMDVMFNF